ncbi:hypothetical protein EV182_006233 [Spiromyces aspiralis]|uniref:Uncharacterized protein n=1 Tax=Spiromyces aspiralis TaxID=68401 RepID=A0ACC1HF06_9FUNG|nr:hypothetical protein EV182_006233 [Spiromyces aspiralis]
MSNPPASVSQPQQIANPRPLAGGTSGPKYPTGPKKSLLCKVQKQGRKYFDSGDYAMSKAGKTDGTVGDKHPSPENIPHHVIGKSPASSPASSGKLLLHEKTTGAASGVRSSGQGRPAEGRPLRPSFAQTLPPGIRESVLRSQQQQQPQQQQQQRPAPQ